MKWNNRLPDTWDEASEHPPVRDVDVTTTETNGELMIAADASGERWIRSNFAVTPPE